MIKRDLKNLSLSNNKENVFKSDLVKISDGLFNCKLVLSDGKIMNIPVRKDGMVNATALCKAGNKKLNDYKRNKQTEAYLHALELSSGIPVLELFKTSVGGNHDGTWVHRKVGLHLAQWISPEFSVQVSNWLDELLLWKS